MHASKKITILAVSLWLISCAVSCLVVPWEVVYNARYELSKVRQVWSVADQAQLPGRILLVGSSPVRMAMSARKIERATGIPSFNLGASNAAEFFDDYLDDVMRHVRTGDIVVVSDPAWLDISRPRLPVGCIAEIRHDCLAWHFKLLPNLKPAMIFLLNALAPPSPSGNMRDARGDNTGQDIDARAISIEPLAPSVELATTDVGKMNSLIRRLRAVDACPLLTLGPVFINDGELAPWQTQLTTLKNSAYKSGFGRFLLSDDVVYSDRADFSDSFEHPTRSAGAAWTDRIIARLMDRSNGPCAAFMAGRE